MQNYLSDDQTLYHAIGCSGAERGVVARVHSRRSNPNPYPDSSMLTCGRMHLTYFFHLCLDSSQIIGNDDAVERNVFCLLPLTLLQLCRHILGGLNFDIAPVCVPAVPVSSCGSSSFEPRLAILEKRICGGQNVLYPVLDLLDAMHEACRRHEVNDAGQ